MTPAEGRMEPRAIAVFGSSEPREGDALYREALQTGRLLAGAGFQVLNGGYGGVMEAASRGAGEAGGTSLGIVCSIFSERSPNRFLDSTVETDDLFERTRELVRRAHGFVVLRGKAGTLAELAFLWALQRAGCLGRRPVVLLGREWTAILKDLARWKMLDEPQLSMSLVVETPQEAVRTLESRLAGSNPG